MATLENMDKKIVLYGAGVQNVRFVYWSVASAGLYVEKIIDSDARKQGTYCYGTEILSPEWLFDQDRLGKAYSVVITARTLSVVEEIRNNLSKLKNADVYSTEEFLEHAKLRSRVKRIFGVQVDLVNHCNLNCACCSHFSPLATGSYYLDEKVFERDVKRLCELTKGELGEFQLVGGEPLLHPQVDHFPGIIRKIFPKAEIVLITNGIKLPAMPKHFFDVCRDCDVHVWITQYPTGFQYTEVIEKLKDEGLNIQFANTGNSEEYFKEMDILPLRPEGNMNAQKNFDACSMCAQVYPLFHGRLYPCSHAPYTNLFNDYFHKQLPGPEQNGIDLFSVKDLQELTDKLSKPIPLCAYCDSVAPNRRMPWGTSKRDISEWTICDD